MGTSQDKLWLIKSSSRILGPYSLDEVRFLLERRKVSILDEVRDPVTRWCLFRDNNVFKEIVVQIRDRESRQTDNTTDIDLQKTKTITINPHEVGGSEKNPAAENLNYSGSEITQAASRAKPSPEFEAFFPPTDITFDPIYEKQGIVANYSRTILIAVLFILIGGLAYIKLGPQMLNSKPSSSIDLLRLAHLNLKVGEFDKAIDFFQQYQTSKSLSSEDEVNLATLLIDQKVRLEDAQQILNEVIAKLPSSDPLKFRAQTALGLSYATRGDFVHAEEVYQSIIFTDERQIEAHFNMGASRLMKSDYKGALAEFSNYLRLGGSQGLASLGKALASSGLSEGLTDASRLQNNLNDLDQYIFSGIEFRLEAQLIKAVIQQKLGATKDAMSTVRGLLEDDPTISTSLSHDLILDRQFIKWERLNSIYCDYLRTKWGDDPLADGLAGFCLSQKWDFQGAAPRIEKASIKSNQDPIYKAQMAYVMNRQHQFQDSDSLASQIEEHSILAQRVLAMNCEEIQNWDCADQKWRRILLSSSLDLGALTGVAHFNMLKLQKARALEFVEMGLSKAPNYIPLLRLKDSLNALH